MITPEEAARIAESNPNEHVCRLIADTENEIESAAKRGRRRALIHYTDNPYVREVADHFRERGFSIDVYSETCGGVMQDPAYYVCW